MERRHRGCRYSVVDLSLLKELQRRNVIRVATTYVLAFKLLTDLTRRFGQYRPIEVSDPTYRKLWTDPRWDEYRDSIGMSKERLDAIEFEVQLPE